MEASVAAINRSIGTAIVHADRCELLALMKGYKESSFLLDGVDVSIYDDGTIQEILSFYYYDPMRSDYFEGHFGGLFPGFGGHGEYMAQTAAGGSVLVGNGGSKIVLLGADSLRVFYPVKGKNDLVCLARPVSHLEGNNAFECKVFFAKAFGRDGESSRLLARATILGHVVSQ